MGDADKEKAVRTFGVHDLNSPLSAVESDFTREGDRETIRAGILQTISKIWNLYEQSGNRSFHHTITCSVEDKPVWMTPAGVQPGALANSKAPKDGAIKMQMDEDSDKFVV